MTEAVFLISVLTGTALLIAAGLVARLNWRSDIEPYGRTTSSLRLAAHVSQYVEPGAIGRVRVLGASGAVFLLIACVALLCKLGQDLWGW